MKPFPRVLAALLPALTAAAAFAQAPGIVPLNGKIVTADENGTLAEALAVRDGHIVAPQR